jgi:hypothetical protein
MTEDDAIQSTEATTESTTPEAPAPLTDDAIRDEMGKVFDRIEARGEARNHRESPMAPPAPIESTANKPFDESFQRTFDYLQMPKAERERLAMERAEIDALKEYAKTHDISLEAAHALKGGQHPSQPQPGQPPQIPAELAPAMESVKQLYGDKLPFHEAAKRYANVDAYLRKDPIDGLRYIGEQLGLSPLQLAQQLAVRFGDQQLVMHNASGIVDQFFTDHPEAAQFESAMLEAVEKNAIRRTGSIATDLQAALAYAQKQQRAERKSRKGGKHIERSMRQVWDRMQSK